VCAHTNCVVQELTQELTVAREDIDKLERKCRDYEAQIAKLTAIIKQLEAQVASLTQERDAQRREIGVLNDEVNRMQSLVAKLTHEKKVQASARVMRMQRMLERAQEETNKQLTENLDNELARAERLDSTKRKLEDQLSERTDDIERERKLRTDNEKGVCLRSGGVHACA
jgi:septal ring factor EnvC (AmiA/AmiB activator)